MVVQNGLINIFEFMDAFDVPDAVQGIWKIMMIPGIFFACLLLKDWVIELWKGRKFRTWYRERGMSKKHKKNREYNVWRQSQIREMGRRRHEKWSKMRRWKRRRILAIGILFFICLTEMFPAGNKEKTIQDIKENQAVLAIQYYRRGGAAVPTPQMIVIDSKGRWKDFYLSDEGLDAIPEMKECKTEDGFEPTPDFFDAVLASERIPFQKRRLILSKRNLENAINSSYDYSERIVLPWDLRCDYQGYFYNITGRDSLDVNHIGSKGLRNSMYIQANIFPLYFVFLQTAYDVQGWDDILGNGYTQELFFWGIGIVLTKKLYPLLRKNSR